MVHYSDSTLQRPFYLQVHASKMESENNLYKQQQYESNDLLKKMYDDQVDLWVWISDNSSSAFSISPVLLVLYACWSEGRSH